MLIVAAFDILTTPGKLRLLDRARLSDFDPVGKALRSESITVS
jgi:hypothetical protein